MPSTAYTSCRRDHSGGVHRNSVASARAADDDATGHAYVRDSCAGESTARQPRGPCSLGGEKRRASARRSHLQATEPWEPAKKRIGANSEANPECRQRAASYLPPSQTQRWRHGRGCERSHHCCAVPVPHGPSKRGADGPGTKDIKRAGGEHFWACFASSFYFHNLWQTFHDSHSSEVTKCLTIFNHDVCPEFSFLELRQGPRSVPLAVFSCCRSEIIGATSTDLAPEGRVPFP
jgi:hypothetical protein